MGSTVKKNKTADILTAKGKFQYSYTDLAAVNTLLEEQGFAYDQYTESQQVGEETHEYMMTQRYKKDENGNLTEWGGPKRGLRIQYINETPQQLGSRITYIRRYSLLMAFGLAAEDDDGAGASASLPKNQPQHNNQPKPKNNPPIPKIDFGVVRETIKQLDDVNDLEEYWKSLKLRENQAKFLIKDFAKRKEELNGME